MKQTKFLPYRRRGAWGERKSEEGNDGMLVLLALVGVVVVEVFVSHLGRMLTLFVSSSRYFFVFLWQHQSTTRRYRYR